LVRRSQFLLVIACHATSSQRNRIPSSKIPMDPHAPILRPTPGSSLPDFSAP
jgi:hypothetical protein